MRVDVTVSGVDRVRAMMARIGPALSDQALSQTAVEVEDYIRAEAGHHQKTGALNSSIYKKRTGDGGWEIGHDLQRAPHAVFVLFGTKAHVIRPKTKKVLRWPAGGKFAFARQVNHPGNKPDDWLARAAAIAPLTFERHVSAQLRALQQT